MACIYNRHNEVLTNKNDLTIYIRNIKSTVQADMLRNFDKNIFEDSIEGSQNYQNKINIIGDSEKSNLNSFKNRNANQIPMYPHQKQISPGKIELTSIHNLKSYSFQHSNHYINGITKLYYNQNNILARSENTFGNLHHI